MFILYLRRWASHNLYILSVHFNSNAESIPSNQEVCSISSEGHSQGLASPSDSCKALEPWLPSESVPSDPSHVIHFTATVVTTSQENWGRDKDFSQDESLVVEVLRCGLTCQYHICGWGCKNQSQVPESLSLVFYSLTFITLAQWKRFLCHYFKDPIVPLDPAAQSAVAWLFEIQRQNRMSCAVTSGANMS